MKKNHKVIIPVFAFFLISGFSGCVDILNENMPIDKGVRDVLNGEGNKPSSESVSSATADQFFWGTWVRMDTGKEFVINESTVKDKSTNKQSKILSTSDTNTLFFETSLSGISSLEKETANVIKSKKEESVIPFYRKGGTNLSYSIRVVGFTDNSESNRAGDAVEKDPLTEGVPAEGITVTTIDTENPSYKDEAVTDENGIADLTAPHQGSNQTVTVHVSDDKEIVVDNLKIENDGDYMGTIPIVNDDDPILKVSGFIAESNKTNGYLYSGNSYIMTIYIKNIGDVKTATSVLSITPNDSSIIKIEGISSSAGIPNPDVYTIPTQLPGVSLEKKIKIIVQNFNEAYIDTKINVNITNSNSKRTWVDSIPLRVYRESSILTIAASSQQDNYSAALNGFIIYPDGNNQFFTVSHNGYKEIEVPLFRSNDSYILVFCGATTGGRLDETTELYYTVSFNQNKKQSKKDFTYKERKTSDEVLEIINFGEDSQGNEREDTAYSVNQSFEAYISTGDTDFYTFTSDAFIWLETYSYTVPVTL